MNSKTYYEIEKYMQQCMNDSAHDTQHVYRVLYTALDIAKDFEADNEILITAALLHDIGREAQFADNKLDHAVIGAGMAYEFLLSINWNEERSNHVRDCISTHRYRNTNPPESIEAKILYDADKIDVIGTLGIARTLLYVGITAQPLYSVDQSGNVLDGNGDEQSSFFKEYSYKLKNVHNNLFTSRAKEIAGKRLKGSIDFYNDIFLTVKDNHENGLALLQDALINELE